MNSTQQVVKLAKNLFLYHRFFIRKPMSSIKIKETLLKYKYGL